MLKFYSKFYKAIFNECMEKLECSFHCFAKKADLHNHAIQKIRF